MANITPKSKTVKGTKKKDTITWKSSSAKYKAITVNALAGNDVINFKKSKYNNKLNGQDGNDTIYGGTKNDTINGGKGKDKLYGYQGNDKIYGGTSNDYINAGKGTNTIYLNKNEGTDTIVKGGGSDTVVFAKEKNFNNFMFYYSANDLLFKAGGSTAKLKDFAKGGHSVKYVQAGKQKYKLSGKVGTTKNDLIVAKNTNNTINAGAGNDIIYGGKGNDVINAGTGNDTINLSKGGNNTVYGEAGNDSITGGTGADIIYGGKGSDTINAGTGRNTIYHSEGDGNDVIIAGGGKDKLSFGGVNSINDITLSFTDNDVVFSTPNGETVTLQNALINAHSVDTIEIGDDKYTADTLKNYISSSDETINGTAWHDDIQVHPSHNYPEVYAGAGNDIIHVKENSKMPYIYVGAGDDTISIDDNNSSCTIFIENGDGNNTLRGLSDSISTYSYIELEGYPLFQSINLGSSFSYDYIKGTKDGDNLVLSLTGGETFTIENYFNLSQVNKNNIALLYEFGSSLAPTGLPYYLKLDTDMVYIDDEIYERADEEHVYDVNKNSKVLIAPEVNYSREFYISGNSNDIVVQGTEEQTIRVQGNNNKIYFGGSDASIYTSDEGSTYADISCTRSSDINSSGNDTFNLRNGSYRINMKGDDKVITLNEDTKEVEIDQIGWANSTTIYQKFNGYVVSDIMLEHYSDWKDDGDLYFYDHISIAYTDENGDILNDEGRNKLIFNGQGYINAGKLNIDDETVGDTVTVTAELQFGGVIVSKTLSQMTQYVDMNNSAIGTEGGYKKYTLGDGVLDIAKGVYVNGTIGDDYYTTGEKSILNLNKPFTVSDKGENGDILYIDNNYQNTRFFMDIDINQRIASDDLYIFYHSNDGIGNESGQIASGLYQFFSGKIDDYGEEKGYIVIENEFDSSEDTFAYGTGRVEHINTSDNLGGIIQNHFDTIKADVAGWLGAFNNAYDTSCNTVTKAIESGKDIWTVSYQGHNLYQIYSEPYNM